MTPESPKNPREALETRLTALLLGELNPAEAAALREVIQHDAALATLHDRLKRTIALVRETAIAAADQAAEEPATPVQLSTERRQSLLAHFKTVRLHGFVAPRRRVTSWLVPLAAGVALLLLAVPLLLPNFVRARSTSASNALLNNLRQLDGAKQQWALENKKSDSDVPTLEALKPYIKGGDWPPSVMGESYVLGRVGEDVTAELDTKRARQAFGRLPATQAPRSAAGQRVQVSPDGDLAYAGKPGDVAFTRKLAERGEAVPSAASADLGKREEVARADVVMLENVGAVPATPSAGKQAQVYLPAGVTSEGETEFVALPESSRQTTQLGFGVGGGTAGGGFGGGGGGGGGGGQPAAARAPLVGDAEWVGVLEKLSDGKGNRFVTRHAYMAPSQPSEQPAAVDPTTGLPVPAPAAPTADGAYGGFAANAPADQPAKSAAVQKYQEQLGRANEVAAVPLAVTEATTKGLLEEFVTDSRSERLKVASRPAHTAAPAPPASPASRPNSSLAGAAVTDLSSVELAPLPIQLPAPSLKGTPMSLPSGPNIEPLGDKPSGTLAGISDAAGKARASKSPAPSPAPATFWARYGFTTAGQQPAEKIAPESPAVPPIIAATTVAAPSLAATIRAPAPAEARAVEEGAARQSATRAAGVEVDLADADGQPLPAPGAGELGGATGGRGAVSGTVARGYEVVRERNVFDLATAPPPPVMGDAPMVGNFFRSEAGRARGKDDSVDAGGTVTVYQTPVTSHELALRTAGDALAFGQTAKDGLREGQPPSDGRAEGKDWYFNAGQAGVQDFSAGHFGVAKGVAPKGQVERRLAGDGKLQVTNVDSLSVVGYAMAPQERFQLGRQVEQRTKSGKEQKRIEVVLPSAAAEKAVGAGGPTLIFDSSGLRLTEKLLEVEGRDRRLARGEVMDTAGARFYREKQAPEKKLGESEGEDLPVRKPATNAPIPQPEIQTRENAFSTFSLNVSDVAFKLAAASLEKGQMPDPASVRSEEFINSFDYRDPEPPPGAPIAFAWERARCPFAHNRDLLRFSLKTAAAGRQAGRPLNLVLLLDNSGSMERADRVQIIREALCVLAAQLQPQDKFSVVTFSRAPRLWVDGLSGDKAGEVAEQVSGLTPQGGTNLEEAMNLAYATALRHYLAHGINRVVLLTDGAANLGNVDPETLKQKVETHRQQGVALDCFGIGWEGYNDDLLEILSRNGDGRYGFVNTPEEAATEFAGQLAGALKVAASDVKVQVEFNPSRVTAYRQIGYAKHQLKKEQFRDNTVDAAEIAAQEAGNALYVVEVNPRGEGPLCIVRVRFKIPGTADYHEHEWAVPYTGNAIALEQASPAMRLAASASAFSEWLVASPFAAEVTPDHLLGYLSGVPEVHGADARPKKLEWMIRQAKSLAGK